jgi:magnesium-transporting ATPase (P-type)
LPWHYLDTNVEVAVTGPAFNFIIKSTEFIRSSVIAKARIFARMSPDDKALLVL